MKKSASIFCILLTTIFFCQKAIVIKSPNIITESKKKKIFLAGTIDMGNSENWQKKVEDHLSKYNVILLNPRREEWSKDWKSISTNPNFRQQVEWELDALEKSDIILMYLDPKSQSPISLLELGLYARSKKLIVICPDGFWRKGNVDITCQKYKIPLYNELDQAIKTLKLRLK